MSASPVRRRLSRRSSNTASSSVTKPPSRPRSYSYHASSARSQPVTFSYGSSLLESLDLPGSIWSLRHYLLGKVEQAERDVKALQTYVEESELEEWSEDDDGDFDGPGALDVSGRSQSTEYKGKEKQFDGMDVKEQISALEQFIQTASHYLSFIRSEIPALGLSSSSSSPTSSLVHLQLSPDARVALDRFLQDHPMPSIPCLELRRRLGESRKNASSSAAALLARVSTEISNLQDVFASLSQSVAERNSTLSAYFPSFPTLPPLPSPPSTTSASLREYFAAESEKFTERFRSLAGAPSTLSANILSLGSEATDSLSHSLSHLRSEANEFTHLLSSHSSAALDEAARIYHAAVEGGRKRLLRYEELPHEWRNNEHILGGYRFIEIESWGKIVISAFEYHNETVNIQTHLWGSVSLLLALIFLLPSSPHALPDSHWADTAIAVLFLVAGMKCLLCSTAWHLLSGCADPHWNRGAACVDYVGISGLIAASVMGMEYYGFYCRPSLATFYMTFSGVLGIAGMILPWQPWFNERRNKMWRIGFFLGLAISGGLPLAHMAVLYGFKQTFKFYIPVVPSVLAYLIGLSFYAHQFPESAAPGYWDNLLASHQLWHVGILVAVWLHWRAMGVWVGEGSKGMSCAA